MKATFDLRVSYEENREAPTICWRYVMRLLEHGKVVKTLLDVQWYQKQLLGWIERNEKSIRHETLPLFLIENFKPVCIADAMGQYQDSPVEDENSDSDFPELDAFAEYRERHLLGWGIPALRVPDFYIGKFQDRHEVSWFPREGGTKWLEVDIDSLFETTRRAAAAQPNWNIPATPLDR